MVEQLEEKGSEKGRCLETSLYICFATMFLHVIISIIIIIISIVTVFVLINAPGLMEEMK